LTFVGILKLLRPPLFILGFLAPYAIGKYFGTLNFDVVLAVGFGNAAFVVFNEIADIEQDRINKPHKPLPSGQVSEKTAIAIACVFFTISFLYLIMLPYEYVKIGLLGYLVAFIYNVLKVRGLIGNLCLGATYFTAAYMACGFSDIVFPVAFGLLTIGHNAMVQYQDAEADARAKVDTIATVWGKDVCVIVSLIATMIAFYMFLFSDYWCFVAACLTVFLAIILPTKIELFVRYGTRLFMLLGFVMMVVGV